MPSFREKILERLRGKCRPVNFSPDPRPRDRIFFYAVSREIQLPRLRRNRHAVTAYAERWICILDDGQDPLLEHRTSTYPLMTQKEILDGYAIHVKAALTALVLFSIMTATAGAEQ